MRRADIVNVSSLRRGAAEANEAIAHGDESTSKVVVRAVGDIKRPPGTTIGAIVRGEEVLIAHDRTVIEQDDHVVMFLVDKICARRGNAIPAEPILLVKVGAMLNLRPITFIIGLVLSKLALFMYVPTLVAFYWQRRFSRFRASRHHYPSGGVSLLKYRSN